MTTYNNQSHCLDLDLFLRPYGGPMHIDSYQLTPHPTVIKVFLAIPNLCNCATNINCG